MNGNSEDKGDKWKKCRTTMERVREYGRAGLASGKRGVSALPRYFIGEGCGYTERDRVCIPVPLYHCFGMVLGNLACTTHGAAMVYPSPTFDARATLEAVQSESCTSLYGTVPSSPVRHLSCLEYSRSPVPV